MKAVAKAHTNIALIKYWGKRNDERILPMNNSLSLTLDHFYTTTEVQFDEALQSDTFILNGKTAIDTESVKISRYLDRIRHFAGVQRYATVRSVNHVPTSAGFASSASGFAALAAASTKALGLDLDRKTLSILARQGSGSACRSVYGGFAEWEKGSLSDGSDSYAVPIMSEAEWDVRVLSVLLESNEKPISSRKGMKRTVETSPFYSGWLEAVDQELKEIKTAIRTKDFERLGKVAEANALKMHATMLGSHPPFTYWQSSTMAVMEEVQQLRDKGIQAYFTIDAGPNVKILCLPEDEQKIRDELEKLETVKGIYGCRPGPGIEYKENLPSR
ncbi:diphosphomevalonate decarboxylase [Virgibacillus sp. MSP4-1]|uniref:diphosphomevalonate decarboxylase n=1 Tax=Virgibacillus sp. MSP4-1 TaxID=2700081 RepID=UPI00039D7A83|nr:diphosphomevalonate decarboxylase [Virgibacillus sp. MSP4-1]QHS21932.1 diphosphomevalonate decarboxylase [Virgibacillus sp. MSP4-1]